MQNSPDTPYQDCTFITSHNSFCNEKDGWVFYQQVDDISTQLENGIRAFMLDLHYEKLDHTFDIYLLHGSLAKSVLKLGYPWKTLRDAMRQFYAFLDKHPDEVVTVFFEVAASTKTTEGLACAKKVMSEFTDLIFDPEEGDGFATPLNKMDTRLVVFSDYRGRGNRRSGKKRDRLGLPLVWHYVIESKFGDKGLNRSTWAQQRDESEDSVIEDRKLALLNHFPDWALGERLALYPPTNTKDTYFGHLNSAKQVGKHALSFTKEQGRVPNFVALDRLESGSAPQKINAICQHIREAGVQNRVIPSPFLFPISIMGINGLYMGTDGSKNPKWLTCNNEHPAKFTVIGTLEDCVLKFRGPAPVKWFNFRDSTGAAKLYSESESFKLTEVSPGIYTIWSHSRKGYLYMSDMDGSLYFDDDKTNLHNGRTYFALKEGTIEPVFQDLIIQTRRGTQDDGPFFASPDGLTSNAQIHCDGSPPVVFRQWGPMSNCVLQVIGGDKPNLYLNFKDIWGLLKLYDEPTNWVISFNDVPNETGCMMRSIEKNKLLYIDRTGDQLHLKAHGPYVQPFFELLTPDTHKKL